MSKRWAKRWLVPFAVSVPVAAAAVPLYRAMGGGLVLGLPWWMLFVEAGLVVFGLWWTLEDR